MAQIKQGKMIIYRVSVIYFEVFKVYQATAIAESPATATQAAQLFCSQVGLGMWRTLRDRPRIYTLGTYRCTDLYCKVVG